MTTWTHDALATDLADHLRGGTDTIVWENMQLGMSGSARPDVFRLARSFAHPKPTVYEVKVSRADFLRDVGAGKWNAYFDFAETVYFAAPAGMLSKADIPSEAGLYVRGPDGWRAAKAARPRRLDTIPQDVLLKLLIDGIDRQVSRRAFRGKDAAEYLNECALASAAERKFGAEAGAAMRDWASLRRSVEDLRGEEARVRAANQIRDEHRREQLRKERDATMREFDALARLLGVDPADGGYVIANALRNERERLATDAAVESARLALERAHSDVEHLAERIANALARVRPADLAHAAGTSPAAQP